MRVVTTTCSNTEIVCALGAADRLVGCDRHSDHPPEVVTRLPRVGADLRIDVEAVRALQPDLVLASLTVPGHERVVEELEAAGLPVVAPAPVTLEDVLRDVEHIGELLGLRDRGRALAARLRTELGLEPLAGGESDRGAAADERPSILVEWWPKPVIVPGRDSWVTELVALAGGRNPFGDRPAKSLPVSAEEAITAAPDAVVISWCGVETRHYRPQQVLEREGWGSVPAVVRGQVRPVPEAYLGRPGPRLVAGLEALRRVVAGCRGSGRQQGDGG